MTDVLNNQWYVSKKITDREPPQAEKTLMRMEGAGWASLKDFPSYSQVPFLVVYGICWELSSLKKQTLQIQNNFPD